MWKEIYVTTRWQHYTRLKLSRLYTLQCIDSHTYTQIAQSSTTWFYSFHSFRNAYCKFLFFIEFIFNYYTEHEQKLNTIPFNGFRTISIWINTLCMIANTVFLVFMVSRDTFQTYVRSERCNCSYVYALWANINVWHISIVCYRCVLQIYCERWNPFS